MRLVILRPDPPGINFQKLTISRNANGLFFFDNADDLEILTHPWPRSAAGFILLTSRDFTTGFSPTPTGLAIRPFDDATGSATFLELVGRQIHYKPMLSFLETSLISFALRRISEFVVKQRLSLKDFLPLYECNAGKINAKKTRLSDYQHTLSIVWRSALG